MTARSAPLVLRVEGLHRALGGRSVLRDTTLSVRSGELVAIVGPSGAGKTTLLRCLAGMLVPDSGTVAVQIGGLPSSDGTRRKGTAFVFQDFNLVKRRSALENVLAGRLCHLPAWRAIPGWFPADDRRKAFVLLDEVGLLPYAERSVNRLSGGQQQRVAIARALAQEPRLLIADEPIASLDPATASRVLALLRAAASAGAAVLCSLHQPELAARWADRTLELTDGALIAHDGLRPA